MTTRVKTFKIHISNMPKDMTQAELKIMFEPFGRIVECEVFRKAYAFVHMEEEECGRAAIKELNGKSIDGNVISVTPSNNVEPPNIPTMKLSVKNVDKAVNPRILRSLFQKFGLVLECEIRMGTAIVTLEATGDIRSAINEMNGFNLEGKILAVEAVKVNLKQTPVPGGERDPQKYRSGKPPQAQRSSFPRHFNRGPPAEQYYGQNNYYEEGYDYGGGEESQYWNMQQDQTGQEYYDDYNMNYADHGHEDFGGGYSLHEDFGEDNYGNGDELPFGYNAPKRPDPAPMPTNVNARFRQQMAHRYFQPQRQQQRHFQHPKPQQTPKRSYQQPKQNLPQPPPMQVAPGEPYPPPPLKMEHEGTSTNNNVKKDFVRKERGGRYRMTSGKKAVVEALAASGVNLPRNYIPTMLKRPGAPSIAIMGPGPRPRMLPPPPRFSYGNEGGEEASPNFLPVAGFRGYRVPMPRMGEPPRLMARGGGPRPHRFQAPGHDGGPVFRNPMGTPNPRIRARPQPSKMLRPTYQPPQAQAQAPSEIFMHQEGEAEAAPPLPPPVMNIDFTADVDFY